MVHLGVELNVISKASLADALAVALDRTGRAVMKVKKTAIAGDQQKTSTEKGR
jgi:rsbT co-antagonist protein RsbR